MVVSGDRLNLVALSTVGINEPVITSAIQRYVIYTVNKDAPYKPINKQPIWSLRMHYVLHYILVLEIDSTDVGYLW
jgi:hypothetical protein